MTLTGYTVAVTAPQQHLVTVHLRQYGAKVVELPLQAPLRQLIRMVIKREVHAVCFINADVAAALVDFAGRAGLRADLLAAFATDVLAAGAARPFTELAIPALWMEVDGELARLVAMALADRRRQFTARGIRFVSQGDALLVGQTSILLTPASAGIMRALSDDPGATRSRATLAQLAPLGRRRRGSGVDLAVSRLRTALGDYSWLVATVSRRGYQLRADSAEHDDADAVTQA
ncbi:MAG TPA: hypothetical protein DGT23_07415 [Micromonosporaceae bacterium]|nr:hypothetical protein [Micromonosporaceae bacterium]